MNHHEFNVAGKSVAVVLHYLDHVVSKDGKTSLIDFSTITSGSNGVITLFLEAKLLFQEDLVVMGVYHAFKDKLEHGITVGDNPAMNILMHIFSTSQAGAIKQDIIPSAFHEPRAENNGVVMILVSESDKVPAIAEAFSAFRHHFSYDLLKQRNAPATLDAALLWVWAGHDEPQVNSPDQARRGTDWLAKTASARMAIFSLSLQQKT